jgi:outer membrane protein OmpA-like peptidoglycan-associated protein
MKIRNVLLIGMLAMLIGCSHAGVWHNTSGGDGVWGNSKVVETVGVASEPVVVEAEPAAKVVEIVTKTDIKETIFFNWDSSAIRADQFDKIDNIVALMNEFPETVLILDGYASEEGPEEYNLQLSTDRANAVSQQLIGLGVPAERIMSITGKGETTIFDGGFLEPNRRVMVISID